MEEIWKDIPGYEGHYQVSSTGKVRSLNFTSINSRGARYSKRGKELKQYKDKEGYSYVYLKNKGTKFVSAHRLVALAFIPNPDGLSEVNHKDEDKDNNDVENLEWCTRQYNLQYGTRVARVSRTKHTNPKLGKPVIQVDPKSGFTLGYWKSAALASESVGKTSQHIVDCCLGKHKTAYGFIWKYIFTP